MLAAAAINLRSTFLAFWRRLLLPDRLRRRSIFRPSPEVGEARVFPVDRQPGDLNRPRRRLIMDLGPAGSWDDATIPPWTSR